MWHWASARAQRGMNGAAIGRLDQAGGLSGKWPGESAGGGGEAGEKAGGVWVGCQAENLIRGADLGHTAGVEYGD